MTCDNVTGWFFRHYQRVDREYGNGLWGGYSHANSRGFGSPYDGTGPVDRPYHSGITWKYCKWSET